VGAGVVTVRSWGALGGFLYGRSEGRQAVRVEAGRQPASALLQSFRYGSGAEPGRRDDGSTQCGRVGEQAVVLPPGGGGGARRSSFNRRRRGHRKAL
jgi:hypothetical protein